MSIFRHAIQNMSPAWRIGPAVHVAHMADRARVEAEKVAAEAAGKSVEFSSWNGGRFLCKKGVGQR